ncbi:Transposon Tf2-9 polyprotein [Amphibalanus amphitrite]|uniref:Transposon Tf2-9 polyprotein n=1 Tax=Amphibalanus amphitrite TaxID=1232801 RepID=A0A6A4VFF2_AMPAM|nr:Transposon Tf2-9 polyprotein [Amphibalanus amphitrite]
MFKGVKGVEVYLDDIVVHGVSKEEHDRRVSEVLSVLRSHKVKVNEAKSVYGVSSISFLGLRVSCNSVQLDPERIAPLLKAESPDSPAKLRSFLGSLLRGRGMRTPLDVMSPERAEDAPVREHAKKYQRAYQQRQYRF